MHAQRSAAQRSAAQRSAAQRSAILANIFGKICGICTTFWLFFRGGFYE